MSTQSFEDLLVWQKAHQYVLSIYRITKGFPKEEMFGLVNQMRRASASITANIAEGFVRIGQILLSSAYPEFPEAEAQVPAQMQERSVWMVCSTCHF